MNENENDLREALRTTMTLVAEPPPMASAAALAAGRRAVRRRVALTGAGATAAVAAVAALAVGPGMQLVAGPGGGSPLTQAGGPGVSPEPGTAQLVPGIPASAGPHPEDTKPVWPLDGDGEPQVDATSRSGLHFNQGKKVLDGVLAGVPKGYTKPTGKTGDEIPLRFHEASIEGTSWRYNGSAAISQDGGTGRLIVDVHTPGDATPTDLCAVFTEIWGSQGACTVKTVAGKQVGVLTGGTESIDSGVAYRYPDGTVVSAGQSLTASNSLSNPAPLTKAALTEKQLTDLAVNPRFHLS